MRTLKVGDEVNLRDNSYCFGVLNGKYSTYADGGRNSSKIFTVVRTGLNTMRESERERTGEYATVCDILITDNHGNFWFTLSRFTESIKHTLVLDGEEITISDKSYQELKKHFS